MWDFALWEIILLLLLFYLLTRLTQLLAPPIWDLTSALAIFVSSSSSFFSIVLGYSVLIVSVRKFHTLSERILKQMMFYCLNVFLWTC